jgi:hypothetical protein
MIRHEFREEESNLGKIRNYSGHSKISDEEL